MSDEPEVRQRILELLMPEGQPVGEPGHRRTDYRMVQGSVETAQEFFDKLRELGEPLHKDRYPGEMVALGDDDIVGLRRHSKSSEPTIDVGLQWLPDIRKIKFVRDWERS